MSRIPLSKNSFRAGAGDVTRGKPQASIGAGDCVGSDVFIDESPARSSLNLPSHTVTSRHMLVSMPTCSKQVL